MRARVEVRVARQGPPSISLSKRSVFHGPADFGRRVRGLQGFGGAGSQVQLVRAKRERALENKRGGMSIKSRVSCELVRTQWR